MVVNQASTLEQHCKGWTLGDLHQVSLEQAHSLSQTHLKVHMGVQQHMCQRGRSLWPCLHYQNMEAIKCWRSSYLIIDNGLFCGILCIMLCCIWAFYVLLEHGNVFFGFSICILLAHDKLIGLCVIWSIYFLYWNMFGPCFFGLYQPRLQCLFYVLL